MCTMDDRADGREHLLKFVFMITKFISFIQALLADRITPNREVEATTNVYPATQNGEVTQPA